MKTLIMFLIGAGLIYIATVMQQRQKEQDKEDIVKRVADEIERRQNERE